MCSSDLDIDKNKTPYSKSTTDGWIGMVQHYFVAAILPPQNAVREFYTRKLSENVYTAGVILPVADIAPGASVSIAADLYAGPQYQDVLQKLAPGLDLVVDYGFLIMLAAPLFWVLQLFHGWSGNWGVAIILLTIAIKALFFPLSAASYRSMAKMKLVTPRLTKLRETYGDDRMKLNQAMMELGATACVPARPRCGDCPLAQSCRAHLNGAEANYPPRRHKQAETLLELTSAVAHDAAGRVLVQRRPEDSAWMPGFWELPTWETLPATRTTTHRSSLREQLQLGRALGSVRHDITRFRIVAHVREAAIVDNGRIALEGAGVRWASVEELSQLPVSTITRKALRLKPASVG